MLTRDSPQSGKPVDEPPLRIDQWWRQLWQQYVSAPGLSGSPRTVDEDPHAGHGRDDDSVV